MENEKPKRKQNQRTVKGPEPKPYLDSKHRNIPIFDPQTGEPNPYYEALTGKPNPLTPPKSKPSPMPKVNVKPTVEYREYARNSRFLVVFPEDMNIKPTYVKSVSEIYATRKRSWFGLGVTSDVAPVTIEIMNDVEMFLFKKIHEQLLVNYRFEVKIQMLDARNIVMREVILSDCVITDVELSNLDYSDDNPSLVRLKIQPNRFSFI